MPALPQKLAEPKLLWKKPVAGECHAGIAVAGGRVLSPDCDAQNDYCRCLDAADRRRRRVRTFANGRELQYGPGPRATPLVAGGRVYLLSAFGELSCLDLTTGQTVWQKNYQDDFSAARIPEWGFCGSPVIARGKLIVHPQNVLALDPATGTLLWEGPASGPNYATPIVGTFGGVEQIVDYDPVSLGGWNLQTGKRLWKLDVPHELGYIVPSAVKVHTRLLVQPASNEALLIQFDEQGRAQAPPVAESRQLTSAVTTSTAVGERILCVGKGLVFLDAGDGLKEQWNGSQERSLRGDLHIVASDNRVLTFNNKGQLTLLALEGHQVRGPRQAAALPAYVDAPGHCRRTNLRPRPRVPLLLRFDGRWRLSRGSADQLDGDGMRPATSTSCLNTSGAPVWRMLALLLLFASALRARSRARRILIRRPASVLKAVTRTSSS